MEFWTKFKFFSYFLIRLIIKWSNLLKICMQLWVKPSLFVYFSYCVCRWLLFLLIRLFELRKQYYYYCSSCTNKIELSTKNVIGNCFIKPIRLWITTRCPNWLSIILNVQQCSQQSIEHSINQLEFHLGQLWSTNVILPCHWFISFLLLSSLQILVF